MKKLISLIVIVMFFFGTTASAIDFNIMNYMSKPVVSDNSGIFFKESIAKGIASEIEFLREKDKYNGLKLDLCNKDLALSDNNVNILMKKTDGLLKDFNEADKQRAEYKSIYIKTDKELVKVKENIPSRTTWYLLGGLSSLLLVGIASLAIR